MRLHCSVLPSIPLYHQGVLNETRFCIFRWNHYLAFSSCRRTSAFRAQCPQMDLIFVNNILKLFWFFRPRSWAELDTGFSDALQINAIGAHSQSAVLESGQYERAGWSYFCHTCMAWPGFHPAFSRILSWTYWSPTGQNHPQAVGDYHLLYGTWLWEALHWCIGTVEETCPSGTRLPIWAWEYSVILCNTL